VKTAQGKGLPGRAWIGLGVVVALLVYVIATGFSSATQYYLTVAQFEGARGAYAGRSARVQGTLVTASVRFSPKSHTLRFDLTGGGRVLPVVYTKGDVPYDFGKAEHAIVSGTAGRNGVFYASQVLVQCPSHYQAAVTPASSG
jgi:cytochrome c-type biogenesis protein CcmE